MCKNMDMSIKKNAYAYEIFPLVGVFYIAFNQTCIFTHAYIRMRIFYAWPKIKYGLGMRIFQTFIKKLFAM